MAIDTILKMMRFTEDTNEFRSLANRREFSYEIWAERTKLGTYSMEDALKLNFTRMLLLKGYTPEDIAWKLDISEEQAAAFSGIINTTNHGRVYDHHRAEGLNLVEFYRSSEKRKFLIMLGTTPSGDLHLANMYTLQNGIAASVRAVRNLKKDAHFIVGFNDDIVDPSQFPYIAERKEILSQYLNMLSNEYEAEIVLQPSSELSQATGQ